MPLRENLINTGIDSFDLRLKRTLSIRLAKGYETQIRASSIAFGLPGLIESVSLLSA